MKTLELKRARKKQSQPGGLIEFVRYFWHVLEPKTDLVEGWALDAICAHLEAVTFGEINRLLINVPPGFMKSLLTDVFWPAWEWGAMNMPHLRYVAFSYSAGLTERDNGKFRDLLMSQAYQEMWGDKFTLRKIGEVKVTNDKTGSKLATSVGGIGTGERGDRVIVDDPHNIKDGESEAIRNETVRWFRESLSNRLNDLERSAIVIIMQRVHEADVSSVAVEMDYTHLMIPMEFDYGLYPEGYEGTDIGWNDPRTEQGELAWPERFPQREVDLIKRAVGPFAFASQYQQVPTPRGGGILKSEWWQLWGEHEAHRYGLTWDEDERDDIGNILVKGARQFPVFDFCIASLDGAFGQKAENDLSALTIWGRFSDLQGNVKFMLVHSWHDRLALHDLVQRTAATCKKYKVQRILVEAKANGHDVASEIRRLNAYENWTVELVNPGRLDKIARAHSIVPIFAEGMVYAPDTTWAQTTQDQCASFPKGAHDDLVDSVTQALRWLRDNGLAVRNEEAAAVIADEAANWKRNREPLYPGVG